MSGGGQIPQRLHLDVRDFGKIRLFLPQERDGVIIRGALRAVHERLQGLTGPAGLVLGAAIRHLSDLLKDPVALARKHALFDLAGGGPTRHRQNQEFPTLGEDFFQNLPVNPSTWAWPENIRP